MTRKSLISCDEAGGPGAKSPGLPVKEKGSFRFEREEHLKGRNGIREVFEHGRRFGCRGAKLFVLKNGLPRNRICFTLSRGYGNAVARNRARRLGREAFRLLRPRLLAGHDLILLVYPPDPPQAVGLSDRAGQLEFLFTKAGLLK